MTDPVGLKPDDVLAPISLFIKLRLGTDSLNLYIRSLLSSAVLEVVDNAHHRVPVADNHLAQLLDDLNNIIFHEVLWKADRCADLDLPRRAKQLIAKGDTTSAELNRHILGSEYDGELISYTPPTQETRWNLLFFAGVGLFVLVLLKSFGYLSSRGISTWKLVLGAFLGFALLMVVLQVVVPLLFPASVFNFPGSKVNARNIGISRVISVGPIALLNRRPERDIQFLTEGVYLDSVEPGRYRLHIRFILCNTGASPAYVYDMHANTYAKQFQQGAPLTIETCRIVVYQDNSILRDGRIYDVHPNAPLSFDIVVEVTRTDYDGYIRFVFGLFVDYHFQGDSGGRRKYRLPSDAIYAFENPPPKFFYRTLGTPLTRHSAFLLRKHLSLEKELA
jgi:hypothetical protein